jgi:hypothetical protein
MGLKCSKHLLGKCKIFPILANMNVEQDILCMNLRHQGIILEYLQEIQSLMDRITIEEENYDEFLGVLADIIMVHNETGSYAYKDPLTRDKWFYTLPNMVYWAALGYICAIEKEHLNIDKVIVKLSKILIKTIKRLEKMALINPSYDNDETILN